MGISPGLACCHLAAARVMGTARHKAEGGGAGAESPHFPHFLGLGMLHLLWHQPFFFFILTISALRAKTSFFLAQFPVEVAVKLHPSRSCCSWQVLVGAQPVPVPPHITHTAPCHEGQAEGKHTAWHGLWFIARVLGANI